MPIPRTAERNSSKSIWPLPSVSQLWKSAVVSMGNSRNLRIMAFSTRYGLRTARLSSAQSISPLPSLSHLRQRRRSKREGSGKLAEDLASDGALLEKGINVASQCIDAKPLDGGIELVAVD